MYAHLRIAGAENSLAVHTPLRIGRTFCGPNVAACKVYCILGWQSASNLMA